MKITAHRLKKYIFERMLGTIFYQPQSYGVKLNGPMRLVRRFNQALNEKGCSPPWIYSEKECLEFWQSIDNNSASDGNRPERYAAKARDVVDALHGFWSSHIQKVFSVLELGCNAGGNLNWLNEFGYEQLAGVEINPNAVAQLHESFPELAKIKINVGDIKTVLSQMPDNSVDVIFTMAVAMHIHPKDNSIFNEMLRVTKKYICTVEPETANSNYVFARNYKRVFEKLGAKQIKSCLTTKDEFPSIEKPGLTLRLLEKVS